MRVGGGSDLARLVMLQRQTVDTRTRMNTASTEATTGLKSSRYEASGGNLTRLLSVERAIDRNKTYSDIIAQTVAKVDVVQETLSQVQTTADSLGVSLAASVGVGDQATAQSQATLARNAFVDMVSKLNGQAGGQSLFSGASTDTAALADAETILNQLSVAVTGSTTAAQALAAIDAYFAPGGQFSTDGYLGSTEDVAPADTGENQRVAFGTRADDPRLVDLLKAYATAAVVADGALPGNSSERMVLLGEAGSQIMNAKEGILDLRTEVGITQERLDHAKAARTAESDTLKTSQTGMLASDQESQAVLFKELENQLNSIFTVTARLTNLSFLNYMK